MGSQGILLGGRLRQRRFLGCSHRSTITTITAGLAREVCEICSHVSVSYIEPAVRLHPDVELAPPPNADVDEPEPTTADLEDAAAFEAIVSFEDSSRFIRCGVCTQPAVFMIPDGLRCNEHAWQAAAHLDWDVADPWVPIRIHRSNA